MSAGVLVLVLGMKLKRFLLRYYPPGIILEYAAIELSVPRALSLAVALALSLWRALAV